MIRVIFCAALILAIQAQNECTVDCCDGQILTGQLDGNICSTTYTDCTRQCVEYCDDQSTVYGIYEGQSGGDCTCYTSTYCADPCSVECCGGTTVTGTIGPNTGTCSAACSPQISCHESCSDGSTLYGIYEGTKAENNCFCAVTGTCPPEECTVKCCDDTLIPGTVTPGTTDCDTGVNTCPTCPEECTVECCDTTTVTGTIGLTNGACSAECPQISCEESCSGGSTTLNGFYQGTNTENNCVCVVTEACPCEFECCDGNFVAGAEGAGGDCVVLNPSSCESQCHFDCGDFSVSGHWGTGCVCGGDCTVIGNYCKVTCCDDSVLTGQVDADGCNTANTCPTCTECTVECCDGTILTGELDAYGTCSVTLADCMTSHDQCVEYCDDQSTVSGTYEGQSGGDCTCYTTTYCADPCSVECCGGTTVTGTIGSNTGTCSALCDRSCHESCSDGSTLNGVYEGTKTENNCFCAVTGTCPEECTVECCDGTTATGTIGLANGACSAECSEIPCQESCSGVSTSGFYQGTTTENNCFCDVECPCDFQCCDGEIVDGVEGVGGCVVSNPNLCARQCHFDCDGFAISGHWGSGASTGCVCGGDCTVIGTYCKVTCCDDSVVTGQVDEYGCNTANTCPTCPEECTVECCDDTTIPGTMTPGTTECDTGAHTCPTCSDECTIECINSNYGADGVYILEGTFDSSDVCRDATGNELSSADCPECTETQTCANGDVLYAVWIDVTCVREPCNPNCDFERACCSKACDDESVLVGSVETDGTCVYDPDCEGCTEGRFTCPDGNTIEKMFNCEFDYDECCEKECDDGTTVDGVYNDDTDECDYELECTECSKACDDGSVLVGSIDADGACAYDTDCGCTEGTFTCPDGTTIDIMLNCDKSECCEGKCDDRGTTTDGTYNDDNDECDCETNVYQSRANQFKVWVGIGVVMGFVGWM